MSVMIMHTVSMSAVALGLLESEVPKVVDACPGNGTRYRLILTPIVSPQATADLGAGAGAVLVSLWPGLRVCACAIFSVGGYFDPAYVAEKLRLRSSEDASAIAAILNEVLEAGGPMDGGAL